MNDGVDYFGAFRHVACISTWFKKGDSAIRPKVTYAFTDHFKGIVGGEIYRGPSQSFFGRLNRTSAGYAELQFGF